MNFKRFFVLALVLVLAMSLILTGCQDSQKPDKEKEDNVQKKEKVKFAVGNWAEGIALSNLAKAILEEKMGYEVEVTIAEPGLIYTSIAQGEYDAFLDSWLPVTHDSYLEKFGDKVEKLGTNYEGARIGLVVPEYVDIDSIEEMNDVKDEFSGEIVGIGSGAGIMKKTEKSIKEYNLDYELVESSGPVMTAKLADAISNKEPVIVTGWKPHWKFARYDLKFLKDPKKIYGETEDIYNIVRKGFKEDNPEVAMFLKNLKLNDKELGSLMGMIADSDKETHEVAKEWMKENEKLVESFIPKK
ncbi:MAG: glycine betaine ABC transporter substrate-binding protein [Firmicutes bacterium]|nr:glycine betaine ABC transporter substrate-binding protein [Bacillota bacterium]